MAVQSVESTRNCSILVTVKNPDGTPYNPTGDAVLMAFMPTPPNADPTPGDWHTGAWAVAGNTSYWAQVLVGPRNGGVVLPVGDYTVWLQVVDSPEVPTEPVGTLTIGP